MAKKNIILKIASIALSSILILPSMTSMLTYAEDEPQKASLCVDITEGGSIVLNQGLEDEKTIRAEINDSVKEFYVYDSEDFLIQVESGSYTFDTEYGDILTVGIISDDGYEISSVDYSDDLLEDCMLPAEDYLFVDIMDMEDPASLQVIFTKTKDFNDDYTVMPMSVAEISTNSNEVLISADTAKQFTLTVNYDDSIINDIRNKLGNSSIACEISYYDENGLQLTETSGLLKEKNIQLNSLLYGYYFGNDFNNMLNNNKAVKYVKIKVKLQNDFYSFSESGAMIDNNKAMFMITKKNVTEDQPIIIVSNNKIYTYRKININNRYNVSGPLGLASGFHIVGFNEVSNNVHTNGNILTNTLYYGSNFGTNGYFGEISYIRSFGNSTEMTCGDSADDILVVGADAQVDFDGDYFYINGRKLNNPCNVYQDTSSCKYIDIETLQADMSNMSRKFARMEDNNVDISTDINNQTNVTITGNGMSVWNVDYSELKKTDNLIVNGISNSSSSSLLINIYVDSSNISSDVRIPGLMLKNVNASNGEVIDFSAGKIIWNIVDSSGECYTGSAINDRQSGGTVLIPNGKFDTKANWNGSMIANEVIVSAESHRTDFTGTSGGFEIKKTLKGKEWQMGDSFTFILSADKGTPMPDGSYISGTELASTVQATYSNKTPTFGNISYSEPGVYEYTLKEFKGSDEECVYDATVYKIKVTVTETNGSMSLVIESSKDNGKTWQTSLPTYEFVNDYTGEGNGDIINNTVDINISTDKTDYDINNEENKVSFTVTPSTTPGSDAEQKDNLDITVTLPDGLTFDEGSANITPSKVTKNEDGTTTISWEIDNVTVGSKIDDITFTTSIDESAEDGDNMSISAEIVSDNDEEKKESNTSINIIKKEESKIESAISQTMLTPLVETGEDIKFKLSYENKSKNEAKNVKICDILPHNDDNRGSDFNGEYVLKSLKIDCSKAKETYEKIKDTVKNYVSSKRNDIISGDLSDFDKIPDGICDDSNYTISFDNINADAASFITTLETVVGKEIVDIYVDISPKDKNQKSGDIYHNDFIQSADNQEDIASSNNVSASVVRRDLSGYIWIDSNNNGIRESNEVVLGNIKVNLYRMNENSKHDDTQNEYLIRDEYITYDAYDTYGDKFEPQTTNDDGYYEFNNLESGDYLMTFEVNDYHSTDKNVGDDTTVDSDAISASKEIVIADIAMPAAEDMSDWEFRSDYNDVGLLADTDVEIVKVNADTLEMLSGAELAIYHYNDTTNGIPNTDAQPVISWFSTKEAKTINILNAGYKYVLVEKSAPAGFSIAEPIVFTVSGEGTQRITMQDTYSKRRITISKRNTDGKLIGGAKLTITGRENGSTKDIEPITWISEEANVHMAELRDGSYVLHEEEPPVGYLTADDVHFTVDKDGNVYISGEKVDEVEMVDVEVKPCTISLKKKDSNGNNLAGVKFSLEFVSAKYPEITNQTGYNRLMKPGQTKEITTDVNGEAVFTNLDQGQYILTEIKTASGNTLLPESITINLPLEMTEKEVAASEDIDLSKAEKIGDIYNFYELKYEISNSANLDVPTTGGSMTIWYLLLGLAVMSSTAAVILISKKQR